MPGSEKKVAQPYLAPKRAIIVYVDLPCSNVSYNSDAFSLLYSVGSSGYLMSNIAAPVSLSRSTLPSVSQSSAIHQSFQPAPTHLSPFVQLLGGLREDFPERERRHRQVRQTTYALTNIQLLVSSELGPPYHPTLTYISLYSLHLRRSLPWLRSLTVSRRRIYI